MPGLEDAVIRPEAAAGTPSPPPTPPEEHPEHPGAADGGNMLIDVAEDCTFNWVRT